jgi:DnaJ-class molecular chaperone
MNTINNFYKLLEIPSSALPKEIIIAYQNKIVKFNNISKLSNDQISDIKMLKIALYVLLNSRLRQKYDNFVNSEKIMEPCVKNKIFSQAKFSEPSQDFFDNEPSAMNQIEDESLDSLFNVDNTWMNNQPKTTENSLRRNRFENNSIGDRVFSMSYLNKRPGYSSDFEIEIRKPLQGREDKTTTK